MTLKKKHFILIRRKKKKEEFQSKNSSIAGNIKSKFPVDNFYFGNLKSEKEEKEAAGVHSFSAFRKTPKINMKKSGKKIETRRGGKKKHLHGAREWLRPRGTR